MQWTIFIEMADVAVIWLFEFQYISAHLNQTWLKYDKK